VKQEDAPLYNKKNLNISKAVGLKLKQTVSEKVPGPVINIKNGDITKTKIKIGIIGTG